MHSYPSSYPSGRPTMQGTMRYIRATAKEGYSVGLFEMPFCRYAPARLSMPARVSPSRGCFGSPILI